MEATPGPWKVTPNPPLLRTGDCELGQQIWGSSRVAFTERQNVGASTELANARLIAAAPDLLEACKAINAAWCEDALTANLDLLPDPIAAIDALRDAIVKAEATE